jgi:transcriptional regulator with XRE-family HTH domain
VRLSRFVLAKLPAKKKLQVQIGRRVRHLRLLHGWSQAELARRVALDAKYIQQVEYGNMLPGLHILLDICVVYGVSVLYFLEPCRGDEAP